ncbi:hypothetical protein-transmembrane prediction [Rhodopirellula baltica SH 1]|uniref:Uncharacterized protein n=1 Tax=Rhodopirellula baltica (strain DSM 10527 / NCIMB 13988 / SH1) TaxID=243090 RepID=Q7UHB5_RHOBA|nr:hypothetical protein-transmembrane prediction [Rhodopirellula baltica SH 1]
MIMLLKKPKKRMGKISPRKLSAKDNRSMLFSGVLCSICIHLRLLM